MTAVATTQSQEKFFPWWLVLIEGIAAIILGLMFLIWPAKTSLVVAPLLGLYWMFDGIFAIVSIFLDRTAWGWKLFIGIIGILAGWFLFTSPVVGAFTLAITLVWILGFMGLFSGIAKLIQAFQGGGWGAGLLGALMIFLGLVILNSALTKPIISTATVPYVIGFGALFFGVSALFMAFRLKK